MIQTSTLEQLLENISIVSREITATSDEKDALLKNPDVLIWLNKIGYSTQHGYITALVHFLKCVKISNPSKLLDLKMQEDLRRRYFPAERIVETWAALAKKAGLTKPKIKKTLDAVRSFFKHNRVPLVQVTYTYKPKAKGELKVEDLKLYREGFNFYGKILFDFILSVPVRDGQFQKCPNCNEDFHPRWRHITTYPTIEAYSPFLIKPQKGHESENYDSQLMQVCFLTPTAAQELNLLRSIKEKALGRKLDPEEYIFTHQKTQCGAAQAGQAHITPIQTHTVGSAFQDAWKRTNIHLSPHKLRSWDNSILATCGIDKQLRDIYLGHSCHCEQGYIFQMIPQWQEAFKKAKAMEFIDVMSSTNPFEVEAKTWQLKAQQEEISSLEKQLGEKALNSEDYALSRLLLKQFKQGKIKI